MMFVLREPGGLAFDIAARPLPVLGAAGWVRARNGKVVQPDEGLRFHPAARWWKGRIRAYLGSGAPELSTLNEGQHVEYEIVNNRGKSSAENLKVK